MGVNPWEIGVLLFVGLLFFGPEKLPEYARKAGRVVRYLRGIANNAQSTLREQLGPEYADLELADLHPKRFVQKVFDEEYADVRREIESLPGDVRGDARQAGVTGAGATAAARPRGGGPVRYDDAT